MQSSFAIFIFFSLYRTGQLCVWLIFWRALTKVWKFESFKINYLTNYFSLRRQKFHNVGSFSRRIIFHSNFCACGRFRRSQTFTIGCWRKGLSHKYFHSQSFHRRRKFSVTKLSSSTVEQKFFTRKLSSTSREKFRRKKIYSSLLNFCDRQLEESSAKESFGSKKSFCGPTRKLTSTIVFFSIHRDEFGLEKLSNSQLAKFSIVREKVETTRESFSRTIFFVTRKLPPSNVGK